MVVTFYWAQPKCGHCRAAPAHHAIDTDLVLLLLLSDILLPSFLFTCLLGPTNLSTSRLNSRPWSSACAQEKYMTKVEGKGW